MPSPLWLLLLALLGLILLLTWRFVRSFGQEVQAERARELFVLQREKLQEPFRAAADATGKPRGLRWKQCQFDPTLELARDRQTGQLVALVPVTIQFEAIEGSDMEGHDQVANLRNASAVFFFERGEWRTAGKAVFNLNPDEALRHFQDRYDPIRVEPH